MGGGTVPARVGKLAGTWPLAVLEIGKSGLSLRMRGLARGFGPKPLEATPATLRRAFPAHGLMASGVGFIDHEGRQFYFWTRRGRSILGLLARLEYPVTTQE